VIREELRAEIEDLFSEWDWKPLGAASLAQCHRAKLKDTGEIVAVKVQHPGVQHSSHLDTGISKNDNLENIRIFLFQQIGSDLEI